MSKTPLKSIKAINVYDNGRDVSVIFRDEKGVKKTRIYKNYPWYFCVESKYADRILKLATNDDIRLETVGDYVKIFVPRDYDHIDFRKNLRRLLESSGIPPLEIDCSLSKRFMIDNQLDIETDIRVAFIDIETDDSRGGIEIGRDRIISWALSDRNTGEVKYCHDADEEVVLREFITAINNYDVIAGWNSDGFDIPYIKARMERYQMFYNWKKIITFDLMLRFIKMFAPGMNAMGLKGFALEEVSQTFVGRGKVKHTEKIFELERDNLEKLKEYNINDVVLLNELDKKLNVFDLMIKECQWTGTFLNRFYVGELLDNYILREAHKQGKYLASQREWSEVRYQVEGAYVMSPITGLHDNVRVFDFKSMYPSIIDSWNISHDTIIDSEPFDEKDCTKTPSGAYYSKRKGVYSGLIEYLLEMRKAYKQQQVDSEYGSMEYNNARAMQEVVKELANSMYGITADPNSRFFNKKIAESITLTGQYLLKKSKEITESMGYTVLYMDTDSLFVVIKEKEEMEKVLNEINRQLKEHLMKEFNLSKYIVELQYEKTYNPLLMCDKKRYSGLITDIDGKTVNKIFTRGLEVIKKDTIAFTRRKLVEFLNMVLVERKDFNSLIIWLAEMKMEAFNGNFTADDLKITKKVSKPISEYKTKLPHVRLAEILIKDGKMLETTAGKHIWGQKIEYIVTNYKRNFNPDVTSHPHERCEVILASDFDDVWDRVYYWNVQTFGIFRRLLEAMYPNHSWDDYVVSFPKKVRVKKIKESKK